MIGDDFVFIPLCVFTTICFVAGSVGLILVETCKGDCWGAHATTIALLVIFCICIAMPIIMVIVISCYDCIKNKIKERKEESTTTTQSQPVAVIRVTTN